MHRRRGFTLVELLVVIGVIAVLISLLLPALNRAREAASQIKCLSNLRQLGTAFLMYTNENHGAFPSCATGPETPDWWIYWYSDQDLKDSAIARYLAPRVTADMFRCPSHDIVPPDGAYWFYQYSYSANWMICEPRDYTNTGNGFTWQAFDAYPIDDVRQRPNLRVNQIRRPSDIILLVDENSQTVDDGCWAPQHYAYDRRNLLSNRHDRRSELRYDPYAGRGNAAFCDGHAEFVPRIEAAQKEHYDPQKDGSYSPADPLIQ